MRRAILAICACLTGVPSALALNPALDIAQYAHTAWKNREGFSQGAIYSITQTADGFLWLATEFGVVRFDGVRAVPWQPPDRQLPSTKITSLLASRDGSLWIGTQKGLARWKDGTLTLYPDLAGLLVVALREDHEGTVWAGGFAYTPSGKLCAIQKDSVRCYGGNGTLGNGVLGLYEDRNKSLWAGVLNGFWRWQPGPAKFYPLGGDPNVIQEPDGILDFEEEDDGTLLIPLEGRVARFADGTLTTAYAYPRSARQSHAQGMLRDRDGGLWVGTIDHGLVHVRPNGTDSYSQSDGLSSNVVFAMFEDREGNVWVGTNKGLDRFRAYAVATFGEREGVSIWPPSVLAARDGSRWWFSADGRLRRWDGRPGTDGRVREAAVAGIPKHDTASLFQDKDDRIWIATNGGVGYVHDRRFVTIDNVPGGNVYGMDGDGQGNLWISSPERGLLHLFRDRLVQQMSWDAIGRQDLATAMAADRSGGGVWLGFSKGGLAHLSDGRVRASYTPADGLAQGRVSDVRFDHAGALWIATDHGISRLKDGRVATLSTKDGLPCDRVGWLVEAAEDRALWLYTECGLVRLARADVDEWVAQSSGGRPPIKAIVLDQHDGVPPLADLGGRPSPSVSTSPDGTIWFLTNEGLHVLDPRHLHLNTLPPPVQIERLTSAGTTFDAEQGLALPPRLRDLTIAYTALSFVAPERVRFRYKLEGFDRDWQDVGNRRQAYYTNLPPRAYRFRVIASNDRGAWNTAGATVAFTIAPAYYQTGWFLALSVTTVLALVWTAHRVRLRIVETNRREIVALNERLMKAQEQERTRIAGELHDGVMQEMMAATMMLGTAKRRIPDDAEGKATIDKVQQKLIQVGADLRQLSHELHPPMLQQAGLPEAVRAYCEEFSAGSGISVFCAADEPVQDLSRGAALALFRIVQEALGNASKHAAASRITVRLTRADGVVSLVVSDDGGGFDRDRSGISGGLGLITIRERANQLGGTFDVESAPGSGTTIRVVIPFR